MKKSQGIIISLLAICLLSALLLYFVPRGFGGGGRVAVLSLSGPIQSAEGGFIFGSAITPQDVRQKLSWAEGDSGIKAIVLRVDSPGGSVAASQEIVEELEAFDRPIVVSMGDVAASGGYFVSAKADRIVASPGTLTGSIGVIAQAANLEGLYEKLGIEMQTFTAGKHKDMFSREMTPEEEAIVQGMVDQLYDQFVQVVAEGRGLSEDRVRSLATGQLYTGTQAKELGLVDELGGLQRAIDLAGELGGIEHPEAIYYPSPPLFGRLMGVNLSEWQRLIQVRVLGAEETLLLDTLRSFYLQLRY
jgi:protease-4